MPSPLRRSRSTRPACSLRAGALAVLMAPVLALAQDSAITPEQLQPRDTDLSVALLRNLLGSVIDKIRLNAPLDGNDSGAFGELFALINSFLLIVLVLSLVVKGLGAMADTAHQGEAMGRERSTVWTPIRTFLSIGMMVPLVNGYCLVQVLVLWATLGGVGLADAIWDKAVGRFQQNTLYASPPPPEARQLAVALLASNLCERVVTAIPARTGSKYVTRFSSELYERGVVSERSVRFSVEGLGEAACGGFVIREPAKGIEPRQGATGVKLADGFWLWLKELLGFADELRRDFSGALMNAHEIAAYRMRDELRPLADQIFAGEAELSTCVAVNTGHLTGGRCLSAIDAAAEHYVANLKGLLAGVINETGQRAFYEFTARARAEGWLTAGSWFYRLMALTEFMNKTALNLPDPYPIRIWEKLPREDIETYGHLFQRLSAVIAEAESDGGLGLTSGDPNNSELDDLSRSLLRWLMEWMQQFFYGDTHPLFAIAWMGHALIATVLAALGIGTVGKAVFTHAGLGRATKILGGLSELLTPAQANESLTLKGMVLGAILLSLVGFALLAALFIPLVPFIIWTLASFHWVALVFESLVASGIWAVWHLRNGPGLAADTLDGWMLLFALMLRPALMVIGLLAGTLTSFYLLKLVSGLFVVAAVNASSGNFTGPVIIVGFMVLFILLSVDLTVRCFALIHRLPDFALRWVGRTLEGALEHHDLQRRTEAAARGAVDTTLRTGAAGNPANTPTMPEGPKVKPMDGAKDS